MRAPSQEATAAPLRSWASLVLAPLPKAIRGDEDGVHDLRVAARRLRAALPILARDPDSRAVRRLLSRLKTVGRAAAATRDLDVTSARLGRTELAGRPEGRALLARLQDDRAHHAAQLAVDLASAEEDVARDVNAVTARGAEALFVAMLRVRHAVDALAADLTHKLGTADQFRPDELHELRITIRRLRYVQEIVGDIRGTTADVLALKRLQDTLGEVQDAQVLASWLRHQARLAGQRREGTLRAAALHTARESMGAARACHRSFLLLEPHHAITAAVVLLRGGPSGPGAPVHPKPPSPTP